MQWYESNKVVGKQATIDISGMAVRVMILDTRTVYGRADYKITPVHGAGACWMSAQNVSILSED